LAINKVCVPEGRLKLDLGATNLACRNNLARQESIARSVNEYRLEAYATLLSGLAREVSKSSCEFLLLPTSNRDGVHRSYATNF
jgi:hypothetical protein